MKKTLTKNADRLFADSRPDDEGTRLTLQSETINGGKQRADCSALRLMVRPDAMNDQTSKPDDFVDLYRRAFSEYGAQALWNMQATENPTPADALAITRALRTHGGMDGRRLAEQIERLCHAPH